MALMLANECVSDTVFTTWLQRVQFQLGTRGLSYTSYSDSRSVEAALLVLSCTQPALLSTVPLADIRRYTKLIEHLRRLTRPFMFMELPPELRSRIYDHALPRSHGHSTYVILSLPVITSGKQSCKSNFELPGITKISKQIRQESLRLFATTRYPLLYLPRNTKTADYMWRWARFTAKDFLRQLQRFMLKTGGSGYHFTFSASQGLKVTMQGVSADKQVTVRGHVEAVEAERKALGLQGESIVMAIIRQPELW